MTSQNNPNTAKNTTIIEEVPEPSRWKVRAFRARLWCWEHRYEIAAAERLLRALIGASEW